MGSTVEGPFEHKVMVPFDEQDPLEVTWVGRGAFAVTEPVARVRRSDGAERTLAMLQTWPVRRALPQTMLNRRYAERLYPDEPITTTQRIIDTFLPLA